MDVVCVYLDFKRTFGSVPHQRLFWKLEYRGKIKDTVSKWISGFLIGR